MPYQEFWSAIPSVLCPLNNCGSFGATFWGWRIEIEMQCKARHTHHNKSIAVPSVATVRCNKIALYDTILVQRLNQD